MKKAMYILAIVTFCLFLIMLINYEKKPFVDFDKAMSDLLFGNDLIGAFHILGETTAIVFIALILLFVLWLVQRNYRGMLFVLLTVGMGRVWNQLIKNWIDRPRPELSNDLASFSFPSGHAMIGLLYLFTIAYLLSEALMENKKVLIIWVIAIILTLLTGLSRIADSHHYATDVTAGWCIGFTWFVICVAWYEKRNQKLNKVIDNT
ncbi:phosphatase PAP2 family protein [Ureibacillus aquaedulcis]|uniref:Phosphatase PAP2 family protein n=1 Tax=Ureibacillus aquaedulcis TaxID=3058421 RepID=A0ABT8GUX8_9BACL|nr:phosphatase PAP2 family protein [Ureibacillus sp. BA0131]MDN4495216.1 phosphatase PAP2 family protein [Ureibacillus sp. BA0131]